MIGQMLAVAVGVMASQEAPAGPLGDSAFSNERRRVMALVVAGDCDGAHGAVFVTADRPMFELVESVCPVGVLEVLRWYDYNPEQSEGMMTEAQLRTARRIANGEDVEVLPDPGSDQAPASPDGD
ncbi:hypothetical protein EGK63_07690 [Brevundimonas sp. 357]|nr:hypothetical protein EGK63_07690 [Brevundimonas sp. 357]